MFCQGRVGRIIFFRKLNQRCQQQCLTPQSQLFSPANVRHRCQHQPLSLSVLKWELRCFSLWPPIIAGDAGGDSRLYDSPPGKKEKVKVKIKKWTKQFFGVEANLEEVLSYDNFTQIFAYSGRFIFHITCSQVLVVIILLLCTKQPKLAPTSPPVVPLLGVGDASLRMHRLHDVLQFFETSLKNRIVKNWNTSFKTSHR